MKKITLAFLVLFSITIKLNAQNNWTVLNTNTSLNLLKIQCYNTDTIYMYGDDGILLKSFDGGSNFTNLQNPSALIYTAGLFKTPDTGFVGNGGGTILRTVNGGSNWLPVGNCTCMLLDFCFSNNQTGLYSSLNGVHRTTDGGSTWSAGSVIPFFTPSKIISLNDSVFVAVDGIKFYKSVDSGQNFSSDTINSFNLNPLSGLSFLDSQKGFIVTYDGMLFKTADQGDNWTYVVGPAPWDVYRIEFFNDTLGFAISGNLQNEIFKTTDGGVHWNLDYTATDLIENFAKSGTTLYACGQNGLALKKDLVSSTSELGGESFHIYPNPATDAIFIQTPIKSEPMNYFICDLYGRPLISGKINEYTTKIDLSFLSAGMYYFQSGNTKSEKINLIKK